MKVSVFWYDRVPEPAVSTEYEGEIIGWRDSQVVVRVKGYSVLRFWKKSGAEVGNKDHARRGFQLTIDSKHWPAPVPGIKVNMED